MSIETASDWKGLRRAGRVARLTLEALKRRTTAGVTTRELDVVAVEIFKRHGARSAPALVYKFPGTVLISVNDEVVHGIPGARTLRDGDVVKLDVTVEKDGYVADAACTVIVGAAADPMARALVTCAEEAFAAGAAVARAGTRVNEIGRAVERVVRAAGFSVVDGLTGHGVGRTIHEPPQVPNVYNRWQRDVLTPGLVITIEPLICAGSGKCVEAGDGWTIKTRDGSLAAHHEHTLVITDGEPVLLTAAAA